ASPDPAACSRPSLYATCSLPPEWSRFRMSRFAGTSNYIATDDLKVAVNAAVALERPLLIKGEPGTGKTVLAYELARALNAPLITWHVKSTTKAHNGLYEYDAV